MHIIKKVSLNTILFMTIFTASHLHIYDFYCINSEFDTLGNSVSGSYIIDAY